MTGIERLREFVAGISPVITVCGVTKTSYNKEHMEEAGACLRDFLADIADQIERELTCDADTIENIRLIVGGVVDEMEHHILGHEGMEDSPVARWARELRGALGATMSRHESDGVADSPYDALRPGDRDAIAWVREHGGLESVMSTWENDVVLVKSVIDELWNGDRPVECGNDDVMDELRRRLVPEGMEWMLWDDGKPVTYDDAPDDVIGVYLALDGSGYALMTDLPDKLMSETGERVKRPEPKVLDADGVEIRVGDRVWSTTGEFDGKRTVSSVYIDPGEPPYAMFEERQKPYSCLCFYLTHRAPVLAADGKPLEVGQTVWDENGDELVIGALEDGGQTVTCRYADVGDAIPVHGMWSPSQLTHTKPEIDTWQRIEEDAGCTATKYNERRGTIFTTKQQVARDLVRRCRALAERERGE